MEMKELDLLYVSKAAKIPYTSTSELLNGKRVDPVRLAKIAKAIRKAPSPEGVEA